MKTTVTSTSKQVLLLLACVSLLCFTHSPVQAQGVVGYANYTFDGTTTCSNENRGPDSLSTNVQSGDPMYRTGDPTPGGYNWAGPHCTQTTSSNDKFNSKDWSTVATLTGYKAIEATSSATYIFWAFDMKTGYYVTGPDLVIHFVGKKNGNGPDQGYVQARFGYNPGSGWVWTSWIDGTALNSWHTGNYWILPNSAQKDFRFKWSVPASNLYTRVEYRLHAFNQTTAGGQGDGFQIDGLVVLGTDSPTPVQLVSFSSSLNGSSVDLKWKTSTEINNYGFEVQRSGDQRNWDALGFVEGRGTINTPQSYSYSDPLSPDAMKSGLLYYRLRQIDRDGSEAYSPVVQVNTQTAAKSIQLFQNYPNPFNPDTKIAFSLNQKQPISLVIYDVMGNEVERLYDGAMLEAGFHVVTFASKTLNSGTYLYTLITAEGRISRTMQIAK